MNLIIGLLITVCCLLLQAVFVAGVIRYYVRHQSLVESSSILSTMLVIVFVLLLLFLGNVAQVAIWALAFLWLGEFESFGAALYHSGVNFSSLGYGDIVMSEARRILGPFEAINGVLMIGVSTAVLITAFQDAVRKTMAARRGNAASG